MGSTEEVAGSTPYSQGDARSTDSITPTQSLHRENKSWCRCLRDMPLTNKLYLEIIPLVHLDTSLTEQNEQFIRILIFPSGVRSPTCRTSRPNVRHAFATGFVGRIPA